MKKVPFRSNMGRRTLCDDFTSDKERRAYKFSEEEIFPICSIEYEDTKAKGAYGNVTIHFKNQKVYTINYEDVGKELQL